MILMWRTVCFLWKYEVRCRPCRCRRAWHGTWSSVCTPWRASPGRTGAMVLSGRSSESKRSEMRQDIMHQSMSKCLWCWWLVICFSNNTMNRIFCHLLSLRQEESNRTFPQFLQWCFLRMTVKGALQAMQELQASSGTQSGGSAQSQSRNSQHRAGLLKEAEKMNGLTFQLCVDLLTFKLALPRLGCQFRWRNGLLTESTVLQHSTMQHRTCCTPQKKTFHPL